MAAVSSGPGGDSTLSDRFPSLRALVVGEAMLDVYLRGRVSRLSPDGPFPVVDSPVREAALGGAANVAANVAALGASATLGSVVGRDAAASELARLASRYRIDTAALEQDLHRQTLQKTRVVGEGRSVVRVDEGSTGPIPAAVRRRLVSRLARAAPRADVFIVSDYRYGVVDVEVLEWLADPGDRPLLVVDSKDLSRFRDLHPDVVTSNYSEVVDLLGAQPLTGRERVEQVRGVASEIQAVTGAGMAAVTLDADGVMLILPGQPVRHVPAAVKTTDPCGAGDTFTAAISLALAVGAEPVDAAVLAQTAAAVVVGKPGTAVCSIEELRGRSRDKWCDADTVVEIAQRCRAAGQSIVFTNGCYDVLHAGHVASLEEAAGLGDVLIVAVNGDSSVTRLKGPGRPVNTLADRIAVLAGLSMVDHIVAFEEDSPVDLLGRIRPDVYCKGGDYRGRWIPEMELVRSWNGRTHYTVHVPDRSTTGTLERIKSNGVTGVKVAP